MFELMTEILIYLGVAAVIGFLLGYLAWGWGIGRKLDIARAEGVESVRTSVDGDVSLRTQLDQREAETRRLETALDRSRGRVHELEDALRVARDDPGSGQGQDTSSQADMAVNDANAAQEATELAAMRADLQACAAERQRLEGALTLSQRQIDDLEAALQQAREDARTGAEETTDRITGLRETRALFTPAAAQPTQPEEPPAALVEAPSEPLPEPTSLLTERPEIVDDLKRIKGVGVVMESVLNEKGIYLFQQVANFTAQDVAWVNEAIEAFPGRIERDNWVGQAQDLFLAKYGRAHDEV